MRRGPSDAIGSTSLSDVAGNVKKSSLLCLTALPLLLCTPAMAHAQDDAPPAPPVPGTAAEAATGAAPAESQQVAFSTDELAYDSDNEIVTATGDSGRSRRWVSVN